LVRSKLEKNTLGTLEENSNKWIVRDKGICTVEDGKTGNWTVQNCTHVEE